MVDAISTLPAAPSRQNNPSNFNALAEAFVAALPSLVTELNTSISQMNLEFTGTYYDGAWSSATGSKTAPKIYSHNDSVWLLLNTVADITASEPSASNSDYLLIGGNPAGEQVLQTLTGTTPTWTMSNGSGAKITLEGNTTITLSGEPAGAVVFFSFLRTIQDGSGSGHTLAFAGATVNTPGGVGLPQMTDDPGAIDDWVLYTLDNGATYTIIRVTKDVQ